MNFFISLETLKVCKVLDLSKNPFSVKSFQSIAEFIMKSQSLEVLKSVPIFNRCKGFKCNCNLLSASKNVHWIPKKRA